MKRRAFIAGIGAAAIAPVLPTSTITAIPFGPWRPVPAVLSVTGGGTATTLIDGVYWLGASGFFRFHADGRVENLNRA